jgi:hypothetical protein
MVWAIFFGLVRFDLVKEEKKIDYLPYRRPQQEEQGSKQVTGASE